jgi:hypothetical protein
LIHRLSVVIHWFGFMLAAIAIVAVSYGYFAMSINRIELRASLANATKLGAYSSFVEESISYQCKWRATPAFDQEIESVANVESLSTSSLEIFSDLIACHRRTLSDDFVLTAFLSGLAFVISLLLWVIQYVLSGNASLLPFKRSNKKTNT